MQENEHSGLTSSNLEKAFEKGLKIAANISQAWADADYATKQKLQYLIFPQGIMYNKEKDTVRTSKVNSLFGCIPLLARDTAEKQNGDLLQDHHFGSSVVRPGFEPRQTVPKTVVLPLHHRTNRPVKGVQM